MNDTINRQAAIDAILHNQEVYSNNFGNDPIDKYTIAIIDNDAQTIAQLPSAQPERKTGKWIKMSDADGEYYACSLCGEELPRYSCEMPTWDNPYPHKRSIDKTGYCPNCGADVRGET